MTPMFERFRAAVRDSKRPWWLPDVLACMVIVALGYFYLLPVSLDIFQNSEARMIGDNSDLVALSWQYRIVTWTLAHEPSRLLYGAIFTERINAPLGGALWVLGSSASSFRSSRL